MSVAYTRHRPLALLAALIMFQVLLLAFQVKRAHDVRLVRYWAVELMTPVESAGTWTFSKIGGVWSGYVGLRDAKSENKRLRDEVNHLELRNRELETQAGEAQRLELLLSFREAHAETPMLAAQVIGASADPTSHTLFINRGERDRIRRNLPVITPDGIVGKIVEVFPNSSQVLLINDKESGVGALFADSRTHGVIKGTGDPQPIMDYVENGEKVHPGETILTSGDDRIFPKGLLVGTVADCSQGNPFQVIHVSPATRLDRLEDVIVLLSQQELAPKKSDQVTSTPIQPPAEAAADPGAVEKSQKPPASPKTSSAAAAEHPAAHTPEPKPAAPQP